jgi:hypothetical protein
MPLDQPFELPTPHQGMSVCSWADLVTATAATVANVGGRKMREVHTERTVANSGERQRTFVGGSENRLDERDYTFL